MLKQYMKKTTMKQSNKMLLLIYLINANNELLEGLYLFVTVYKYFKTI